MSKAHSERAHALLSPSAAGRWSKCPGSVPLNEEVPDTGSSPAANEGTAAHMLAAHCLDTGLPVSKFAGRNIDIADDTIWTKKAPDGDKVWPVSAEMVKHVNEYVKLVRHIAAPPKELHVEVRVNARQIDEDCWGTSDAVVYDPTTKHLHVFDLKYGRGVVVEAVDNDQGGIYASGARSTLYHNRPVENCTIHIFQPRAPHPEGPHRTFTFDLRHLTGVYEHSLNVAAQTVRKAVADRADIGNGITQERWFDRYLKAGDHCMFCKVKATCPAQRGMALETAQMEFSVDDNPPDPATMTPDELGEVLAKARKIQHWIKAVEEHANAEAHAGRIPTGFKLVPGRAGARKWRNEEAAVSAIPMMTGLSESELFETKLLSPKKIEDKLTTDQAKVIASLVEQSRGASQLVPIEDGRRPAKAAADAEFTTLEV